jgi:hypothetical protein
MFTLFELVTSDLPLFIRWMKQSSFFPGKKLYYSAKFIVASRISMNQIMVKKSFQSFGNFQFVLTMKDVCITTMGII